jgi:hypothetical protein
VYAKEHIIYNKHLVRIAKHMNAGYGPTHNDFTVVNAMTSDGTDITIPLNYIFKHISLYSVDIRQWLTITNNSSDLLYMRIKQVGDNISGDISGDHSGDISGDHSGDISDSISENPNENTNRTLLIDLSNDIELISNEELMFGSLEELLIE